MPNTVAFSRGIFVNFSFDDCVRRNAVANSLLLSTQKTLFKCAQNLFTKAKIVL